VGEASVKTFISCVAILAVGLLASWIYWYGMPVDWRFLVASIVFGVLLCLVRIFPIAIAERWEMDAADVVLVTSVVILGPVWAAMAALPYNVMLGRKGFLRTAYEVSHTTVFLFIAGMVFSIVSVPLLVAENPPVALVVYATVAAGVTLMVVNNLISMGLLKIKYRQSLKEMWKQQVEPYLLSDTINVATAGLGVLALLVYGPVAAIVVVSGSVASQVIVYRSRDRVAENLELKARISSLEESLRISNTTFGAMMVEDLGRRDGYTHLHAAATSVYAADIADELKMNPRSAERLRMAGLLHNIGMFELPEDLLIASGKLNSIAKGKLAEHPAEGEAALASVTEFEDMATWVRWHHERPDGRGYPDRLRGPWIPIEAKVLAAAQAYAAMVLDQPRRPGMDFPSAREELNSGAGTQFDEVVVRAFLRILDTASEGYRMADDHRFIFPATRRKDTPRPVRQTLEAEPDAEPSEGI
jgi:HD-GYP domain-containing protein (c-di-GMP phosphodiesterase class II)